MTSQAEVAGVKNSWLRTKLNSYRYTGSSDTLRNLIISQEENPIEENGFLFKNPFKIEDLTVFDSATLRDMLHNNSMYGLNIKDLACGLRKASPTLLETVRENLAKDQKRQFNKQLKQEISTIEAKAAQQHILDSLFWELTYWKTPELYEELTEGEQIHPGIFRDLQPFMFNKIVLDAGAGSGRASFECLRRGAKRVFALEPSPGLLHILEQKLTNQPKPPRILPLRGRFDNIPLENNSVDMALACSAFTADAAQGGDLGLAELIRVTKPGGKVVIIWPRIEDYEWLAARDFQYVAKPLQQEMQVKFRSFKIAQRCAQRFYAHNTKLRKFLNEKEQATVPFSILGFNPPHDYCWLEVKK